MLVHICCSVDSHFFLKKVKELFPDESITGFFYNPNIHPYSEYYLRLLDVKRSCDMLGVRLIEGDYDYLSWMNSVRGFEKEPEKGARCTLCFDKRVQESMRVAKELGEKRVTTTLLVSPKKSIKQLEEVGEKLSKIYGVEFVSYDLRVNGGTQEQFLLAREDRLYHQDYCGCIYALKMQRELQKRVAQELFEAVNRQILPNSLQERVSLYEKRIKLEEQGMKYELQKERFLNFRTLRAYIKTQNKTIPSYFLSYSYIKRKKAKLKVEKCIKGIYHSNRESIKIVEIKRLNKILNKDYKSVKELLKNPLKIEDEIQIRGKIEKSFYSLSPILIVDKVNFKNFEIYCETELYQDVREVLYTKF